MTDTDIIYCILRKTCKVGVEETRMKKAITQMFSVYNTLRKRLGLLTPSRRALAVKSFIESYRNTHSDELPTVYTTYEEAMTLVLDYKANGWNVRKVDELMEYPNWEELLIYKINGRK